MRVGIYDPYLDDLGGGEKYMMTIVEYLSKNHRVTVFWDRKSDVEKSAERFSLDLSQVEIVPNIFTDKISSFQRLLQTKAYDVLIILSDGSIPLVASKKLFVHIQQPLAQFQGSSLFGKVKVSRVNGFFCNSLFTKSFLEKKFGVHPVVVYPPVALFPKDVKKENIIVHVGRFRSVNGADYKKQSVMIEAFKEMVEKGLKDWTFVIATSVHEKDMQTFERMRQAAKGYPVQFLINKGQKELWDMYNKAKIYWHASGFGEDLEKHPEFAEHFGMSTVEAMGAGAVPVVINAGGQKEIVKEGENGLFWETLEELQEKTLLLIKDSMLLKKLSGKARESAKAFSKEAFCQKISAMIS